jgi:hypothetical protein
MGQLLTTTTHGQDFLAGSQVAQQLGFLQIARNTIKNKEKSIPDLSGEIPSSPLLVLTCRVLLSRFNNPSTIQTFKRQ